MQKCIMWKPEPNNKTLPTRMPPMEQQKEIQYPEWHKDITGKGLWSGEDMGFLIEIDVWENIEITGGWQGRQA